MQGGVDLEASLIKTDVLIVGTGHAGAHAAIALRQHKFTGSITLVGDEPELPYERPPLSKDYLAGEKTFDQILIKPAHFWAERNIDFRLGCIVASVEPDSHVVSTAHGTDIQYRTLIWAAGGAARRLTCSGSNLDGIHSVRTRGDIDRMKAELPQVNKVLVVGGGYIGLEAAAVLAKLGKKVTILETLDRVLSRVAGERLSRFFEAEHRRHGVEIRLNEAVSAFEGKGGRVTGARLMSGQVIPADLVVVGVGIVPAVQPLEAAGAVCDRGVIVDEYCATSLPDVFAIGDCTAQANPFYAAGRIRLESVQNAAGQALTVAKFLTGTPQPYDAVPWFWSNQFDLRLQTVGLSSDHDAAVVRGDIEAGQFSIVYYREGCVIAFDCVNAPRDYVQGGALIKARVKLDPLMVSDTSLALKDLAEISRSDRSLTRS